MKRIVVLVLMLAGCTVDRVNKDMPYYVGKPVDLVVARVGMPTGEQTIMGRKTYIWTNSSQFTNVTPVTTTGYVGNKPVQMTTYQTDTANLHCTFRVFVDGENRVTGWDIDGDNGECTRYARKLHVEQ